MQFKKDKEGKQWEYNFKYAQTGMPQGETMSFKKVWDEAIKLQLKQGE